MSYCSARSRLLEGSRPFSTCCPTAGVISFSDFRGKAQDGEKLLKTLYFTSFPGHLTPWAPNLQLPPGAVHKLLSFSETRACPEFFSGRAEKVADFDTLISRLGKSRVGAASVEVRQGGSPSRREQQLGGNPASILGMLARGGFVEKVAFQASLGCREPLKKPLVRE